MPQHPTVRIGKALIFVSGAEMTGASSGPDEWKAQEWSRKGFKGLRV